MSESGLATQARAGVRWTATSSAIAAVNDVIRNICLARFLQPLDFGLMAIVYVAMGFAEMYADAGISAAVIQRQNATRAQLSTLYWLNLASGFSIAAIMWSLAPAVGLLTSESRVVPIMRLVCAVFAITPTCVQFDLLLQKDLAFKYLARRNVVATCVQSVVAITLAARGFGVWAMAWGYVSMSLANMCLLLPIGLRRYRPLFHFRWKDLDGFLRFGLYQLGERTGYYLAQKVDQVLIGATLGASALGMYSFAWNIAGQPLTRINPILTKVAFPIFSKAQDNMPKMRRGYLRLTSVVTAVNAPLLVGLLVVAPIVIPLVYGEKWLQSVTVIQWLCIVGLLRSIGNPVGCIVYAKGMVDRSFWWQMSTMMASVPFVYFGAKWMGIVGVAQGLSVLQVLLVAPLYFLLIRPAVGACGWQYGSAILRPGLAALFMGVVVSQVPLLIPGSPLVIALSQIILGAALYVALLSKVSTEVVRDCISTVVPKRAAESAIG
jgi:O-antigen/teichoic acid export membrane protein